VNVSGTSVPERYARIPEAVLYDGRLSSHAVRVYGVIVRHSGAGDECWPSQARIGQLAHLKRTATSDAIGELVKAGHVERVRRGRTLTNTYRVMFAVAESPEVMPARAESDARQGGEVMPARAERNESQRNESHRTKTRRSSSDALPGLDDTPRRPAPPARRPDPHREAATAILGDWWERQEPRPQIPYPAARKVLEKALRAGWPEPELRQALEEVPAVSGAALDFWRRRRTNGTGPSPRTRRNRAAADAAIAAVTGQPPRRSAS
jgi:Helix-turn-helix domain